jgi:hypothetical protein
VDCTSTNEVCVSGVCQSALVGTYTVTETVTVTDTSGTSFTSPGDAAMTITQGASPTTVEITLPGGAATECTVPATVEANNNFSIEMTTCAPFTDNNGCTDTFTYTSGGGSLSGGSFTASLSGTYTQSCPGASGAGTFTVAISGTQT